MNQRQAGSRFRRNPILALAHRTRYPIVVLYAATMTAVIRERSFWLFSGLLRGWYIRNLRWF